MVASFSFDPYDASQRENAKRLIEAIEAQLAVERTGPVAENKSVETEDEAVPSPRSRSQVKNLLETEAGRSIYGAAIQYFTPSEAFTLDELATKAGHAPGAVLAWWRRLGGRHHRLGGILFTRHEGRPVRFSLDQHTWDLIHNELQLG